MEVFTLLRDTDAIEYCSHLLVSLSASVSVSVSVPCIFQPMISEKFKIHDTCGVNNLHGMPGILAGIIGAIVVGLADEDDYGYRYKGSFTRAS